MWVRWPGAVKKTQLDTSKTHGVYLVLESQVLLCNHLHLTFEEVASRERRKTDKHKKLTFTTFFS